MRLIRSIVALAVLTLALPPGAEAQSGKSPAATGTTIHLSDSLRLAPEFEKSLDALAAAVQALAIRVATDPQLRMAAMQVASGFVITAQQIVVEHSAILQEALKTAAERIAVVQETEGRRPRKTP